MTGCALCCWFHMACTTVGILYNKAKVISMYSCKVEIVVDLYTLVPFTVTACIVTVKGNNTIRKCVQCIVQLQ